MRNVYIVGGNGFARECYLYLLWMSEQQPDIKFAGFLGHGGYGHTVDYLNLQNFYLGEVSEHKFNINEYVVIGAGYPEIREKIYKELKTRGINMFNIIAPYVYINPTVEIGEGNVFVAPFSPGPNVRIGNGNVFNGDVVVGHDAQIGDFNFFGGKTQVLGGVKIGNSNKIGTASVFLPHSAIGNHNDIAPISAIYKGCKDNCYMQGNPALKVGEINA
ncbi:MAG: transferase [Cyanobacteriota bacterium]|nr:transferase [Cyanobacteriota bacterium]MDY6363437.1 transferase [Cyanobacteriota bacterium]